MWKKEGTERQGAPPARIVVEQWICFVLGFICMAFGIGGLCIKPGHAALSSYMAQLGSLYVPTLRVTAIVCIGFGVTLIRRGWAHL
jgi:cytochrome c oxidase assembly factor CtaG